MLFKKQKPKIFCIGNNKTGTTSIEKFFKDHGYHVAPQRDFELLNDDYIKRNWKPIIELCKKYEVFQDVPFSNFFMYPVLHAKFPDAKFILTVRDSAEEWYQSISKSHSKIFGKDGNLPTKEDLMNANYVYKGYFWKYFSEKFGNHQQDVYNRERLIDYYCTHNNNVRHYFKNNPNFLELNVAEKDAIKKLSDFLNITAKYNEFPHENKTQK